MNVWKLLANFLWKSRFGHVYAGSDGNNSISAPRGWNPATSRRAATVDDQRGVIRRRAGVETLWRGRNV